MPRPVVPMALTPRAPSRAWSSAMCEGRISGQEGDRRSRSKTGTPIRTAILKRIEAGQLKEGDSVDSERELARINKVSLMTARHALATLEKEGMVERRRGAGTFVAPPKIHFNKLMSYTEQMASSGLA